MGLWPAWDSLRVWETQGSEARADGTHLPNLVGRVATCPKSHRQGGSHRRECAMDEGGLESSSEEGSSLDEPSWVSWFCMLRNHEFFCEVDPAFIQDRFNLYGLKEIVGPLYGEAMTMILGYAPTGNNNEKSRINCRSRR